MKCFAHDEHPEVDPVIFTSPEDPDDVVLRCPGCHEWMTEDLIPIRYGLPWWAVDGPGPWEVAGAIGSTRFPVPTLSSLDNSDGRYDWPPAEVHAGVAAFVINLHGDDPGGAWIRVVGPDRDAVVAAWVRAKTAIKGGAGLALFG